jgi:hypothetical protein
MKKELYNNFNRKRVKYKNDNDHDKNPKKIHG